MRATNLQKNRSYVSGQGRSYSPNSFGMRGNYTSTSNVSVHSEHLWNMLEDVQLFPDEIHQLFRYQQRNLSSYKRVIEREKLKVNKQMQHLKNEVIHNIDDLRISILAELDRIYKNYMQKYATLKSQIVQIKKMKDEMQMDIDRRSNHLIPKYSDKKDNSKQVSHTTNNNIMRSLEKNNFELKKYQVLNYIAQLQKQKIIPLQDITKELIVLTQYQNGYFQNAEFQHITNHLIADIKNHIRSIYDRKYEFIRQPQQIFQKDQEPILNGIYQEQQQQPFNNNPHLYQDRRVGGGQTNAIVSKLQDFKVLNISPEQQNICLDWAENITLQPVATVKNQSQDIILCSLQVTKNIMAIGSKDGQINIYQISTGKKIANLRGHKTSICKLALIINNGKKYLASGSDHGCSSIVLWDVNTWNMRMRIQNHKAAVTAIVDLQDNRSMVSGSYDKTINVYNLNSQGKIIYNLPVNKPSVTAILLNCTGNKMISCGLDDTLNVWQVVRGAGRLVQTMFLQRIIQNNTMICSLIASIIQPDVVLMGAKDGKIKLINIDRGQAYKTINACNNAVIEMAVVQRKTKPDHPIVVCWPCNEECMKIINTESGKVDNIQTKGFIQFGCGIGPKGYFLNGGRSLAMLSQSRQRQQVNIFKVDIN